MLGLLKSLFGNKKDKDIKELQPYVGRVNDEFNKLASEKLNIPVHLKEGWKMNELKRKVESLNVSIYRFTILPSIYCFKKSSLKL